ncbi:ABC transporter substrate-binding protein [Reyranella sp.]|uniref:ABC transporter substrate-binding protein n=1 Tax=Reyranella sp. TaxID=1929291 RepID=UPI003D0AB586
MNVRLSRRRTLGLAATGTAALLAAPRIGHAQGADKVALQTSWRAQAEQGGYYQAMATGLYKQAGLEVEIKPGGPQLDANALLLANRVEFIESNMLGTLNFARENLPGVAIASFFQKDPRVLLSHPGVGNDTLPALKGKPILVATAGRQGYWLWLKAKYGYTDDQVRPYTFNMAPFLADKTISMQGLLTSEPYAVRQAGVDPVVHLLADHGFANYQATVMTSPRMIADKADVVQRFVDATIKGWVSYLGADPAPGNALIKKDNPDMTDDKIAFAIESLKKNGVVGGGDAPRLGFGAMTTERWHGFYKDMADAGALPAGLAIDKVFTTQFVNKKVGMT